MTTSHELTSAEQLLLDGLLERYRFTPIVVRLSATMLDKAIIDARHTIQVYLARAGIVEFSAIGQGQEHKVQVLLPLVSGKDVDRRRVSLYRPHAKQGDPRFWIERLASVAQPQDALILAFADTSLVLIHLRGSVNDLCAPLNELLPSRYEERGELEAVVQHLTLAIAPLATTWVRTGRAGPTGVGFTLESQLGIAANSSRLPDFAGVELKAYRKGAMAGPGKLVTLFAKTPDWLGLERGRGLLQGFGYQDAKRGRLALYCTITATPNSLGWRLRIDPSSGRLLVMHKELVVLSYDLAELETRLLAKHPATLFVRASSRGRGKLEEFCYDDATLCREPSIANMLELIDEGLLGLDFTLHARKDGSTRDHGYLWRIREFAIPRLYAYRRALNLLDTGSGSP